MGIMFIIDILFIFYIMFIIDIMDIIDIIDIVVIMEILENMNIIDIMVIMDRTDWTAMAGAVLALVSNELPPKSVMPTTHKWLKLGS